MHVHVLCMYLLVVDVPLEDGRGVPAAALAAHPRRPAGLDRQTLLRSLQKVSRSQWLFCSFLNSSVFGLFTKFETSAEVAMRNVFKLRFEYHSVGGPLIKIFF